MCVIVVIVISLVQSNFVVSMNLLSFYRIFYVVDCYYIEVPLCVCV